MKHLSLRKCYMQTVFNRTFSHFRGTQNTGCVPEEDAGDTI
jgi:hypothetical protein